MILQHSFKAECELQLPIKSCEPASVAKLILSLRWRNSPPPTGALLRASNLPLKRRGWPADRSLMLLIAHASPRGAYDRKPTQLGNRRNDDCFNGAARRPAQH